MASPRVVLATLTLTIAACDSPAVGARDAGVVEWRRAPSPPLSARELATGVSIGRQALFVGGSEASPCPSGASCRLPRRPPLRDGALFDPVRGTWKAIRSAPVGFDFANIAVLGATVYYSIPGTAGRPEAPPAFLAYHARRDRWSRLPRPALLGLAPRLVAAGDVLVAFNADRPRGDAPIAAALHRASGTWRPLPADPLPRGASRTLAWDGRQLVAFGSRSTGAGSIPPLAQAAALSLTTRRWRRLPDAERVLAAASWIRVGSRLVNPSLGTSDGGGGDWGDDYPNGGALDASSGTWSLLPNPPPDEDALGIGVVTATGATYLGSATGWVLDAERNRWVLVPPRPRWLNGTSVTAAGRTAVAFGGARFTARVPEGRLSRATWTWSPPR